MSKEVSRRSMLYGVSSVIAFISIFFIFYSKEFNVENARYLYSAMFQGFAALLAITLTAVLITLQTMSTQKNSTEEQIYRTLESNYPSYIIPATLETIAEDVNDSNFEECFRKSLDDDPLDRTEWQRDLLVDRTTARLKRNFAFLLKQEKHSKSLHMLFKISVVANTVVLLASLLALHGATPFSPSWSDTVNYSFSEYVMTFCILAAVVTLISSAIYFFVIVKIWKFNTFERVRKSVLSSYDQS